MSDHASADNDSEDYYAILGVDPTADAKTIRKAYLKQSLAHHPDKNVHDPETAKKAFVRIGEAYEVLSDPAQRAAYDRHRRSQRTGGGAGFASAFRPSHDTNNGYEEYHTGTTAAAASSSQSQQQQQKYESYREAFDATMAGLSEDELRDVMGAAALIGSIVGSIAASRLLKKSNNALVRGVGSVIGSRVASEAATSMVATAHRQSTQRAALDQERRERIARGEPVDDVTSNNASTGKAWKDLAHAAQETAKFVRKSLSTPTNKM